MRYLTLITVIAIMTLLIGCAKRPQNYLTHAWTVPVMRTSTDMPVKRGENYYPLPSATPSAIQSPSLVPPGSNLQRFENQTQLQQSFSKRAMATLQQSNQGSPVMVIVEKPAVAWSKVERALQKTPYQILDQDSTLHSYYVLDVKGTNNKITKATPIYRVYLKAQGNQTEVILLSKGNQPAAKDVSQRILTAIQQKIA
ncbi:outer membrane protein assembly factor BamC [Coxiella endosymbiont of Ornithodoros amblus]|uniref:outer membrane protein assembly factor BamC n=1 Tax=Coxiella endosymbiont of Ornithodoros amblus TaxID=1656166 RepID=UPI00244E3040|nr:outer membrane protein assembly factor BamC [Coxiella endosymbiont of Ornithodoros amblus]MBW5802331.1 outer membrane protein assembly factor BamC [Coxiella endosymbiont of Ornithodoros amblus]